jgi:O-antigen/teichoic acid export membrane protein
VTEGFPTPRLRSIAIPLTALRIFGQGTEFVGWVLFARALGTSHFGDLSIAFLACRYGGLVADWGASFRGPRDVAAGWNTTVRKLVGTRARVAVALSLVAVAICFFVGSPELAPVAAVTLNLGFVRDWIALGRAQGARAGIPSALQGGLLLVGAVIATNVGAAAIAVGLAYAIAAAGSVALNSLPAGSGVDPVGLNGWSLLAVLSNQVSSTADVLLLGVLSSASAAGIYAAVYRLPNAWIALLGMVLAGFLPLVTRALHEDHQRYRDLLHRSLRVSRAAAFVLLLLSVPAYFLVPVLFGSAYDDGQVPMLILMLSMVAVTLAAPLHAYVQAPGADRRYATILTTGAVVNVTANLILIPLTGLVGAAIATLITQSVVSLLLWETVRRDPALSD